MKVQTAFRLDKELIEALKSEAKKHKRSLNNYVELVLHKMVEKEANAETILAIEEAIEDKNLDTITDIKAFLSAVD